MDLPAEVAGAPPVEAAVTPAEVAVAPSAVVAVAPPAAVAVATPAVGAEALLVAEAAQAVPLLLLLHRSEEAARGAARGDPTAVEAEGALGVAQVTVTTDPRLVAKLMTRPGVATERGVVTRWVASAQRRSER